MTSDDQRDGRLELLAQDVAHLREMINARELLQVKALELAASETKVHLQALNHEAEQLKEMQTKYLPREVYDTNHKDLDKRVAAVEKSLWRLGGALTGAYVLIQLLQRYKII